MMIFQWRIHNKNLFSQFNVPIIDTRSYYAKEPFNTEKNEARSSSVGY